MALCASDWIKLTCGDIVREHEGRHFGRVMAIDNTLQVRVLWEGNPPISQWLHRDNLVVVEHANAPFAPRKSMFHAKSAKQELAEWFAAH